MVLVAFPRTAFHHCSHGVTHERPEGGATVQADAHCPICEAPVPLSDVSPAAVAVPLCGICARQGAEKPEGSLPRRVSVQEARGPPVWVHSAAA